MKIFTFPILLLLQQFCFSQTDYKNNTLTCNNWLSTPSQPSYFSVGDLDVPGNKITVEATFNRTSFYSNGTFTDADIVSKHTGPFDVNYLLRPTGGSITTTNGFFVTPNVCPYELNKTYHVAMVYDGVTLKFYRNGFLMSQVAATGNLFQNNWLTTIGFLGTQNLNENFVGYINEVRIWNVVRTQAQIQTYMNSSLPNPATQTGLLAYYTFDNLLNKQGNATWNGTLGGGANINQTNPNCTFVADSCYVPALVGEVINSYTPVIAFNPCENKITVEDASSFNIGDTVLMMQMKGAVIDSSNTASFGTITDYKNAGNYEFNYVKSKTGNIIELKNVLVRQYDIPTGKVQLVRVPYYNSAVVTSLLTCLPWDGNKGGVLAFNVRDTLSLNNKIDISGKGFFGGKVINPKSNLAVCNQNNYYYSNDPVYSAPKGEGIAAISSLRSFGRGPLANGGGGGTGHNSGGGGGNNGTAAGKGGKEWSNCSPLNDNGGLGGNTLVYSNTQNRIFLGGGGGAGHCDNLPGFNSDGGNGGGIAIIQTNYIKANSNTIAADGADGVQCIPDAQTGKCHEGMGGGGGGGTVLLKANIYLDNISVSTKGGKGADMSGEPNGQLGPGGGGSGGIFWSSNNTLPANVAVSNTGGSNGVNIYDNDPWTATSGQSGTTLFNLKIPTDTSLFKKNIDSVKIKDSITSCNSFNFNGLGYTNTNAISSWYWNFGDNTFAYTQNTSHAYSTSGTYTVKLIVYDINGCSDSATTNVTTSSAPNFDFTYKQDVCNPLSVQFFNAGTTTTNPYWSFGDGGTSTGNLNPVHTYPSAGNYTIKFTVQNGTCNDTVIKIISLALIPANIITTPDTTICFGSTKQLHTVASLSFCWTPTTYLNDPTLANPTTSATQNITYYFNAAVTGTSVIVNGDFNAGNTGFTTQYQYANPNVTEGQYFVGSSPQAWNSAMSNCGDHTSGTGNMLLVNGSPTPDEIVWNETVTITPNTNYAFSTWIQALWPPNPAQLQFSINGRPVGTLITASLPTCTWTQFYTTWNSGNNTTANISIINKNTQVQGNDFALDDISFAPVTIKRDSVIITVDKPSVKTNNDTTVCSGSQIQINTTGAATYTWSPITGLSNGNVPNPVATVNNTISYVVTGTTVNGCSAKDTLVISTFTVPVITVSNDTTICHNTTVQLSATGGSSYLWSPASTLNNPNISNPVATPTSTTNYFVTVTDSHTCSFRDSVLITVKPVPVFSVTPNQNICAIDSKQLLATGGTSYLWTPSVFLTNANIANPVAKPDTSITYSVKIKDNTCNDSATLNTRLTVFPLPIVRATKSNDVDCSNNFSQLNATGALQYLWSPSSDLNNSSVANPIASPKTTTQYLVTGIDANGCTGKDSITINVSTTGKGLYLMPNAFTPNNDGLNDCFGLKYWGTVTELDFSIYNRFGQRVFHTTDPTKCWDGRYKGQLQNVDVFVYTIKAKTLCDSVEKKGYFILLK